MTLKCCLFIALLLIVRIRCLHFVKMTLDTHRWEGSETQDSSFLSCSLSCHLKKPTCLLFSWSNARCHLGQVIYTWDRSDSLSVVYVNYKDHQKLLLQDQVRAVGMSGYFEPIVHIFKHWQFLVAHAEDTHMNAQKTCEDVGGHLPILQSEDILDFYIHEIVLEMVAWKQTTWMGLSPNHSLGQCQDSECDGTMTWDDGQSYVHEAFIECTERDHSFRNNNGALVLKYEQQSTSRHCWRHIEAPFPVIRTTLATNNRSVICQLQLE